MPKHINLRRHKATRSSCIYCNAPKATTEDHVPPKCFFQEKLPNGIQRITVKCCETCREKDAAHDGVMRDLFASISCDNAYVGEHLLPARDRAFESSGVGGELAEFSKLLKPTASSEIYRVSLRDPTIARFIERTGRGLLFHLQGVQHFEADFNFSEAYYSDSLYQHIANNWSLFSIPPVIAASASPLIDGRHYFVIIQFYRGPQFALHFNRKQPLAAPSPR